MIIYLRDITRFDLLIPLPMYRAKIECSFACPKVSQLHFLTTVLFLEIKNVFTAPWTHSNTNHTKNTSDTFSRLI